MDMFAFIREWFHFVGVQFSMIRWTDILDILILSVLLYGLFYLLHDSRAANVAWGIVVLLILWLVSYLTKMYALAYLLRGIFSIGVLALIIIFQPEIRGMLEKVGDGSWRSIRNFGEQKDAEMIWRTINEVSEAAQDLSRSGMGALIVIERATKLGDIIRSGILIDAKPSSYLLCNIFFNKAPLHDGAVIIRENRVCAAGCMLPLTASTDVDQSLGTRHRAALGMSESSDAVIVVVSEETSSISLACGGVLTRGYSFQGLKKALADKLLPVSERGAAEI